MKSKRKYNKAIKAIIAYKECTGDQAIGILAHDGLIDVHTAYKDGKCDALYDATATLRDLYGEALIDAGYVELESSDSEKK